MSRRRSRLRAQVDYDAMSKKELVTLAQSKGIPASMRWNKQTIINKFKEL